jgi:3-oxoacyl-[acyl-carrier protein] reductase
MDYGIQGRVALVTGASAGLGFASAKALAAEGVSLAIVSRSKDNLERAAVALHAASGVIAETFTADLADLDSIPDLVAAVRDRLGPIAILVANAGGPPAGTFADTPRESFDRAYRLTLMSNVELCRAVLPDMKAAGWGRIVAITSSSVKQPIDGLLLSNTFRAGVTGFLKTLSREVGAVGITVNSVAPGYADTERLADLTRGAAAKQGITEEEVRAAWAAGTPMKRLGTADEIGAAVAWLCSAQASFVTGVVLPADGGRAAGLL